jgi:hypothetical protein
LLVGAVLVYGGFAWWLPLATPGALVMLAATLAILWPRVQPSWRSNRGSGEPFVPVWIRRTVHPGSPVAPGPRPGIDS